MLSNEQDTVAATAVSGQVALLKTFAARLPGLDQVAFAAQLDARTALPALKAADAEQRRAGIASQPIFQIGTQRLIGFQSIDAISRALDVALRK